MADVYICRDHREEDLELAAQLAHALESEALFVTWSLDGHYFEGEPEPSEDEL